MQKTNSDWWRVTKSDGQEGFVPANYVKEIEPKVVEILVDDSTRQKPRRADDTDTDQDVAAENAITNRQKHINASYKRLIKLGQVIFTTNLKIKIYSGNFKFLIFFAES